MWQKSKIKIQKFNSKVKSKTRLKQLLSFDLQF